MGDGDHASVLLDQPQLHVLEVISEKVDLGIAVRDRLVQVLVEQLVSLSLFRKVTVSPRFKAVEELIDGDLSSGLERSECDLSLPDVLVQVQLLSVVSRHEVAAPG